MSEDMILEYQETFNIFDNRGDQKIHAWQIGEVLRACGQNPTESEWRKFMGDDQDRRLNFNEFLPMLQEIAKNRDTSQPADFVEGFKVFDKEQNGTIGSAELRHLLTSLGERMTEEECEQLFQGYEDSQGNISYEASTLLRNYDGWHHLSLDGLPLNSAFSTFRTLFMIQTR